MKSGESSEVEEPVKAAVGKSVPVPNVLFSRGQVASGGSYKDAIVWVSEVLHAADVVPQDAPSAVAANLLIWARRNDDEFYKTYFTKLLPTKMAVEGDSEESLDRDHQEKLLSGYLKSLQRGGKGD